MYWNEKIDLIKKEFSDNEFSVPHVDRKSILRQIETKFISRADNYYDLNNFNERFYNWWENIKEPIQIRVNSRFHNIIESVLNLNESYWIAFEFNYGVRIYKSHLEAMLYLSTIGQTWTKTFHIIQLKFDYLLSVKIIQPNETQIKMIGNKKIEEKIKTGYNIS